MLNSNRNKDSTDSHHIFHYVFILMYYNISTSWRNPNVSKERANRGSDEVRKRFALLPMAKHGFCGWLQDDLTVH